jgi:hypothetical protein
MGYAKSLPAGPKYIGAHFTNSAVVFNDVGRFHNQIPTQYFGIKFYSGLKIRYRNTYLGKSAPQPAADLSKLKLPFPEQIRPQPAQAD